MAIGNNFAADNARCNGAVAGSATATRPVLEPFQDGSLVGAACLFPSFDAWVFAG